MKLSMLNLAPIRQGQTPLEAINSMVGLAKLADELSYERFWIAEHHNMPNLASAATPILIAHVLANTDKIRIGSGGIMLPNHSPLSVAEQFGTLATIYPNRVELGLGRAPGTDGYTALALRRNSHQAIDFTRDIAELRRYFADESSQGRVRSYLSIGQNLPFFILGSSTDSAYLAAELGLPYVFASHFATRMMQTASEIYRREFRASENLQKPYFIVCLNVIVGMDNDEANFLATSQQQLFLGVVSGRLSPIQPPCDKIKWSRQEELAVNAMLSEDITGDYESAKTKILSLSSRVAPDEIMALNYIFDEQKQHDSFRLLSKIVSEI